MFLKLGVNYALGRLAESQTWLALIGTIEANLHIRFNSDLVTSLVHVGVDIAGCVAIVLREGWRAKAADKGAATAPAAGEQHATMI